MNATSLLAVAFVSSLATTWIPHAVAGQPQSVETSGIREAGNPQAFEGIAERIEALRVANEIPSFAVAVVKGGEIVFERGFGWADREARISATEHTPYCIASVSKLLTATAIMRLVEQGEVNLDQPVNAYLGPNGLRSVVGDPNDATVRQVANHTAGLFGYLQWVYAADPTREVLSAGDLVRRYGVIARPPGERFVYSNLGFGVLEDVIERVSSFDYADYMERRVFLPLGMYRTSVGPMAKLRSETAVKYLTQDGRPLPDFAVEPRASGEIYSTAHDLALFAAFLLTRGQSVGDRSPIAPEMMDEMFRPTFFTGAHLGRAVAWNTVVEDGRPVLWQHSGGGDGMGAVLEIYPQQNMAFIGLVNTDNPAFAETRDIVLDELQPGLPAHLRELIAAPLPEVQEPANATREEGTTPTGVWKGTVEAPEGRTTLLVEVTESGAVRAKVGRSFWTSLDRAERSPTGVSGRLIGLVDERYGWSRLPHVVELNLEVHDQELRGEFRAIAINTRLIPHRYRISFPVALTRVQDP